MEIADLPRTTIRVKVPPHHKTWMAMPKDSITIDGHQVGPKVSVGLHQQINGRDPHVTINDQRVLYPTDLYFNEVLVATDNGLLWDMRPKSKKAASAS